MIPEAYILSTDTSFLSGTLHLTDFVQLNVFDRRLRREREPFVSKIAAAFLAFVGMMLFSLPMSAQFIPRGNVYLSAAYASSVDVTTRYDFKGWNASAEAI